MKTRLLIIIGIVLAFLVLASSVYVISVQSRCESLLGDTHYPRPLTFWNCLDYLRIIDQPPEPNILDNRESLKEVVYSSTSCAKYWRVELFAMWENKTYDYKNDPIFIECSNALEIQPEETGSYELAEVLCLGHRGMILNEKCERIGKYDIQTGIPIVENKDECDLLNGTWYDDQNKCDSKYAPIEYRLQFGYSFLGYEIPQICTDDMIKHLAKYSNLLDDEFNGKYGIEDIGLPDGVSQEKFDECVDFIYEQRTSTENKNEN